MGPACRSSAPASRSAPPATSWRSADADPGRRRGQAGRRAHPGRPAGLPQRLSRVSGPQAMRRAMSGLGAPTASGWKIAASASIPSTSRGPGRANDALASTAHTGMPLGSTAPGDEVRGLLRRALQVVAAGRHDDDLGPRRADRLPGRAERLLTRRAEHAGPAGPLHHLGHPVARGERRVGPLEHEGVGAAPAGHRGVDPLQPLAQTGDEVLGGAGPAARPAEGHHRGQHLVEGVRVDGEHVRPAAEVGEGVVDHGDVDRAYRAQVLGDDEVGVEVGQGALVEVVEVLAGPHPLADDPVDVGGAQALGQRGGGDDPAAARLGGVVALEGDADDVIAGADREQDLGRRGQERHDPHVATLRFVRLEYGIRCGPEHEPVRRSRWRPGCPPGCGPAPARCRPTPSSTPP